MGRMKRERYWLYLRRRARRLREQPFDPTRDHITWGQYGTPGHRTFWALLPKSYLRWILANRFDPDEQRKARLTLDYIKQLEADCHERS